MAGVYSAECFRNSIKIVPLERDSVSIVKLALRFFGDRLAAPFA